MDGNGKCGKKNPKDVYSVGYFWIFLFPKGFERQEKQALVGLNRLKKFRSLKKSSLQIGSACRHPCRRDMPRRKAQVHDKSLQSNKCQCQRGFQSKVHQVLLQQKALALREMNHIRNL